MLDTFEIVTTSGVVLWSRTYAVVNPSVINNFIADTFIEEKSGPVSLRESQSASTNPAYKSDQHTLKWTTVKELGVIFVVVYRSLLHLSWVDKLVDNIKTIFVSLYGEQLKKPHTTLVECAGFDQYFDQQVNELDKTSARANGPPVPDIEEPGNSGNVIDSGDAPAAPGLTYRGRALHNGAGTADVASTESTPVPTPGTSRPSTPGGSNLIVGKAGPGGKLSRRARKAMSTVPGPVSSGDEISKKPAKGKKGRKWDADGFADEEDDVQLDYSSKNALGSDSEAEAPLARSSAIDAVDSSTWGQQSKGKFVLRDLGDEVHDILASAQKSSSTPTDAKSTGLLNTGVSAVTGLFRNVVGGKTLTKSDLDTAMKGMQDHLVRKNVALEAALRLCEGVEKELLGVKTGSFESISSRIQSAMEASLTKMLTPTSSLDLLRDIDAVTKPGVTSLKKPRPYVISIVGVNGVGKSTNLSKICYFLLQNRYRVLIAAGDTFRSGAVEQLAVHVRNLKELTAREGGGEVDLYQKGYGKDAATVAKDAVTHAASSGYDVVLIDTAGRRHNDQRLMSSLEKFAKFAQPDKILMVGEALVGTDSVAQARNFNAAFGTASLDGFIISKCDTVGDMVGTLVSLVHATNVPVLFVGVGQHYSDLRNFSVKWAVEKLLSSSTS
ncbi:uncharacterized protein J7T54_008535 [Emericellopsis cladophorae]|uniref:Signal recognition particle receptor subunit alpha homolog n=1 Tax=Emericellopsis cladophorae TaxID=2686198 RepID=A0A9P9XZP4_9HYPO|nr:uncharacterized protein J7T54_008535 [Emericellopsis cladophorae]KAI6780616.1 hypothetical protein J7T54_008535 [Emericellopsis cladophorae]